MRQTRIPSSALEHAREIQLNTYFNVRPSAETVISYTRFKERKSNHNGSGVTATVYVAKKHVEKKHDEEDLYDVQMITGTAVNQRKIIATDIPLDQVFDLFEDLNKFTQENGEVGVLKADEIVAYKESPFDIKTYITRESELSEGVSDAIHYTDHTGFKAYQEKIAVQSAEAPRAGANAGAAKPNTP